MTVDRQIMNLHMFVGPVGICWRLNRHPYPLSHMYCMVIVEVYDTLVTHCMLKVI